MQLRIESLLDRPAHAMRRAVAIGNFDGVHLGHARLLGACVDAARRLGIAPSVLTFDPHPAAVVSPQGAPPQIQTRMSRLRSLRDAGIVDLVRMRFDKDVAGLSPAAFVEHALIGGSAAGCVIVGQGFRFGVARSGDVAALRALGRDHFETIEVPALQDGAERVSSSRLRAALREGDLLQAARLLGRPFEIEGTVIHGDHRGRTIGFPTANIDLDGASALGFGVYVADGHIEGEAGARRAAVNLGVRPTFAGQAPRLEAHFPGFNGDLYGRSVRLIFLGRLRDERTFDSFLDLKSQLAEDVRAALDWPGETKTG